MSTQTLTNSVQFTESQIEILLDAVGSFYIRDDQSQPYTQNDVYQLYDLVWKLYHSLHDEVV
jgi:hypothetical protein